MKKKSLATTVASIIGVSTLALVGVVLISNGNLSSAIYARANGATSGSFVFTASDFTAATGDFVKAGVNWHYEGASVSGSRVTLKKLYNTTAAGADVTAEFTRGSGFNTISMTDYSESEDFVGGAIYTWGFNKTNIVGRGLAATVDLSTAQTDSNLRRLFEITEGAGTFSFTTMTVTYGCEVVNPQVKFDAAAYSVEEGATEEVSVTASFLRKSATYEFDAADDEVIQVVPGNSDTTARVTGLKTGSSDLTVTMTTDGVQYHDTVKVTVTEGKLNIIKLKDAASISSEGEGDIKNNQLRIFMGQGTSSASISNNVITINHVGGQWWETQVFFRDAYFDMNNEYKVSFTFNASHAGKIQLSNTQYDVVVGDNTITRVGKPHNNLSTMSLQLGADGHGSLANGTYTISNLVIKDLTNDRYNITFDNEGVKEVVQGCAGKKLWSIPDDPVKADYIFDGWYLGENKVDLTTFVPTASVTLEARYSQEPTVMISADKVDILKDGTATITATAYNFSGAVTYSAIISDPTVLSATNVDNVFTITGLKDGSATVAIKAVYDTEEATSEALTINVGYVIPENATAIGTKAEFLAFFNKSAENTGKNAYLTADINLGGDKIEDIRMAGAYTAIFEGCGHSVTNYTGTRPFFNIIGSGAEVRNVSFVANWGNASGFGVVAYENNGLMFNVDVEVTLSTSINTWAPLAIAGSGNYTNCDTIIHGDAAASSNALGAVARGGTTFTNCTCQYSGINPDQFADKDNVTISPIQQQ